MVMRYDYVTYELNLNRRKVVIKNRYLWSLVIVIGWYPSSFFPPGQLYVFTLSTGYIFLLKAGLWIRRLLKNNLMEDVFNDENESFMQEIQLMENEYSVNLPTIFQHKGKSYDGWVNVVNPFRASIVLGTPGSGKSYAVVNSYIKQQIQKGFSMYI